MCRGELIFMEELGPHGRYIDACMVKDIRTINGTHDGRFETLGCCCGHGKYQKTVVVKQVKDFLWIEAGDVFEFFSTTHIPRTRRFYIRDEQGLYYIPEVVNAPR